MGKEMIDVFISVQKQVNCAGVVKMTKKEFDKYNERIAKGPGSRTVDRDLSKLLGPADPSDICYEVGEFREA